VKSTPRRFRSVRLIALGIAASAAPATAQQLEGAWSWTWHHVAPGTTTPITPQVPGVVSPGEAVEFRGSFSFAGLGTIQTASSGFSGPVVGLGYNLSTFRANPGSGGSFYGPVFRHPSIGGPPEVHQNHVGPVQIGQFAWPGMAVEPMSTFPDAVRIRWDPVSYDARLASFVVEPALPAGGGPSRVLILYDPVNLYYDGVPLPVTTWGSVQVPIVPAPSGAAAFMAAALFASRRRRRNMA
jgi:hypothetical protein